jgi:predicted pyridoxine 5'-phosphate oxidase superfamily flavin-nucleotide-binding protein
MVSMPKEAMDLLTAPDPAINKVIATVNAENVPNVAPMGSIVAISADTIVFMDGASIHTKENLMGPNKKVAISIWKGQAACQIKGTFVEYQTSGPVYEGFKKGLADRGIVNAPIKIGVVKVDEVFSQAPGQCSKKLA